ncbi:DUF1161 domain-containing protein [Variovorax sp.]|uniref:DUF1161 domain-containing protein n=1 Tax=Variovorax sp. TaxID=1871043 RepID=UPI002D3D1C93|nr:DUF1161 domain-containing protein [Variovorax sp.]HYP86139.1 DUF1161 domain-containing protein [Variovorax sp.]
MPRKTLPTRHRSPAAWLVPLLCALAGAAHAQPSNCEDLRAQIEAKIGAAGVSAFTVTVIDANAPADGQVVGTCAQGTRQIVYTRTGAPTGSASPDPATPAPPPAPRKREAPIITECKDGSTSVGGTCPK